MNLTMLLLVRDEADIIARNIEHHLNNGVDFIVAVDNGSVDGTRDILADYERAGRMVVIDEPEQNYNQSVWVTQAAEYARDVGKADWIFSNDADEFWLEPGRNIKTEIATTDADVLVMKRVNMFFAWNEDDDGDWADKLRFHVTVPEPKPNLADPLTTPFPSPFLYWNLPPKVLFRADAFAAIEQGNHTIKPIRDVKQVHSDLVIRHFPVRSSKQFLRKIVQGGESYERNTELPRMMGWHWRRWYKMIQQGQTDVALGEVMPSRRQLNADLNSGRVVEAKPWTWA